MTFRNRTSCGLSSAYCSLLNRTSLLLRYHDTRGYLHDIEIYLVVFNRDTQIRPMETNTLTSNNAQKRSRAEFEDGDAIPVKPNGDSIQSDGIHSRRNPSSTSRTDTYIESSSDDDFGPALPSAAPKKKRRKLPYEKLYVSALPASPRYSKSLMHKDQLSFVTMTPFTDFLITSSIDGVVKFWKKVAVGIESVKEFRAHTGEIKNVSVSQDGRSFATAGADKTIKIFDVITFGMIRGAFVKIHC